MFSAPLRLGTANSAPTRFSRQWILNFSGLLAVCSFSIAQIALIGYRFSIVEIVRPLGDKSIHPATALAGMLVAVCTVLSARKNWLASQVVNAVAICLIAATILRLLFPAQAADALIAVFPAGETLQHMNPPTVPMNSALCICLLALALRFRNLLNAIPSQTLAFLANGLPTLSLIGYLLGVESFHGQMSLTTVLVLIPLCAAVALNTVDQGFLRSLIGPKRISAIARRYLLLVMLLPYLLGLVLFNVIWGTVSMPIILLIVATSQVIGLCVCFLAFSYVKIERRSDALRKLAEAQAQRDPLTGTLNRASFTERAGRALEKRAQHVAALSLLFIDVDHFKRINDRYGHATGDLILKRIAQLSRGSLRHADSVARWGGEEFLVLLPATTLQGAFVIAEKIRQAIGLEDFPELGNKQRLTVSIGCAEIHADERLDEAVARADKAMYTAKGSGRNQTVAA